MNFEDEMDRETLKRLQEAEPTNAALADGIQMILRRLWPQEELERLIEGKHRALCAACPYRPKDEPVELPFQKDADADAEPRAKDILGGLFELALTIVKSPWFWLPVATVCAVVCARYGISLPTVGGAN